MKVSNLTNIEFKTLVIRILKELSENFNEKIVSIKTNIKAMGNTQS